MNGKVIQSVRFQREFFTLGNAIKILNNNIKLKPIKPVDITRNQFRFRIIDPKAFESNSFKTVNDMKIVGVSYVIGKIRKFVSKRKEKKDKKKPKFDIEREIRLQRQFTRKIRKPEEAFFNIPVPSFILRR